MLQNIGVKRNELDLGDHNMKNAHYSNTFTIELLAEILINIAVGLTAVTDTR